MDSQPAGGRLSEPYLEPLARMYAKRRMEILQRREMGQLAAELRRLNKETEPLRKLAEERRKAGVRGEGFVMRSSYSG